MTISEVIAKANAEQMSVADALVANADQINNIPTDEPQALVEKLAETAKADKCKVEDLAIPSDGRFTDREKTLLTPALIERAERLLQKQTKGKAPPTKVPGKAAIPTLPYNVKRDAKDRWWVVGMAGRKETGEEHGPFVTKKEADLKRKELITAWAKADYEEGIATRGGEPTEVEAGQPDEAEPQSTTTPSESEQENMATKTKKKTSKAPKQPKTKTQKAEKPAKAPREKKVKAAAENGKPKKLSALTAAYEVLKGRTKPMSAKEIIALLAERKLWESPGGTTPEATLSAAIGREIAAKGNESRFSKPEPGRFLAN